MALNFGILQPVNIGGQFMAGRQQAQEQTQRNELAQQQALIREQEMGMRQQEMGMRQQEATERTEDRALKLKKAETRSKFLTDLSAKMEEGGHKLDRKTLSSMMNFGLQNNETSLVDLATKGLTALDEQDQFQSEMGRFAPAASMTPTAPAVSGALGSGTFDPNAPAPVAPMNALAPAAPTAATPVNAMVGGYTRPQIEQMLLSPTARVRETGKNLLAALPKTAAPAALPVSIAEYERAKTDPEFMKFLQARAAAQRAPAAPRPEQPPVAVVGPDGKQIYVTREEALRGRMTPAAAMESLPPKEIQKREAALPQARQSVKSVSNTMSVIGQTVDSLLANPDGINGITGLVYGITPAITGPARKAKAELDQLKNLAFIQGITELRAASKTGAAVGNVSNREGDRFENLKASLDRQQDKDDLIAALKKLKQQAELTSQFMTEAFDETYSYKSGGTPAPAATPGRPAPAGNAVDTSNPLLK